MATLAKLKKLAATFGAEVDVEYFRNGARLINVWLPDDGAEIWAASASKVASSFWHCGPAPEHYDLMISEISAGTIPA